jgi:flagellar motor switch/type III secretory pathway protein FliN
MGDFMSMSSLDPVTVGRLRSFLRSSSSFSQRFGLEVVSDVDNLAARHASIEFGGGALLDDQIAVELSVFGEPLYILFPTRAFGEFRSVSGSEGYSEVGSAVDSEASYQESELQLERLAQRISCWLEEEERFRPQRIFLRELSIVAESCTVWPKVLETEVAQCKLHFRAGIAPDMLLVVQVFFSGRVAKRLAAYSRLYPLRQDLWSHLEPRAWRLAFRLRTKIYSLLPLMMDAAEMGVRIPITSTSAQFCLDLSEGKGIVFRLNRNISRTGAELVCVGFTIGGEMERRVMNDNLSVDLSDGSVEECQPTAVQVRWKRDTLTSVQASHLEALGVEVEVMLGSLSLSLQELLNLEVGARIVVELPADRRLVVALDGVAIAEALLVEEGQGWALEIVAAQDSVKRNITGGDIRF